MGKTKNTKKAPTTESLNCAFLKYFPITPEEKQAWKEKETVSLGEAILRHYGISFLDYLAFEIEQLIDTALFIPKHIEKNVTADWVLRLFSNKIHGYSLPYAFLGICFEEGILTKRQFIEAFDHQGICWKLISYWNLNRDERDKDAVNLENLQKKKLNQLFKTLKIKPVQNKVMDKSPDPSQIFSCSETSLHELKYEKLTEGMVKLYGAILLKNNTQLNIKELLNDPKKENEKPSQNRTLFKNFISLIEKVTGDKRQKRTITKYLKQVDPKNY
jgi:hypothetical protein